MIDAISILIIGFIIIFFIDAHNYFDKISKWFIYTFQIIWGTVLFASCFSPNGLYLPSLYTYFLLILNVLCFTIGFVSIRVNGKWHDSMKDKDLYKSAITIFKNKKFIIYLIIITLYILSLLKKYLLKITTVNSLGELRSDFFYDNFYGDWFNYINLLFLNPTQIVLLGLTVYGIFKYRKPIILLQLSFIMIYSTLAGGRLDYATIFISFLFFITCLTKLNTKRLALLISLAFVVTCVFSFITNMRGNAKGSSISEQIENGSENLISHLVTYTCGGVVAFDYAVNEDYINKMGGLQYGALTFSSAVSVTNMITKRVGLPIQEPLAKVTEYKQDSRIAIGRGITHNALYTAMLFPYLDFGIVGVIIIPYLLGMFIRIVIKRFYIYHSLPLLLLLNQCYILIVFSIMDFRGINFFSTIGIIIFLFIKGSKKPRKDHLQSQS